MRTAVPAGLALAAAAIISSCDDQTAPTQLAPQPAIERRNAEIVPAAQAVRTSYIPSIDPGELYEAEIEKALAPGPGCAFSYTRGGRPVFVARVPAGANAPASGVVKINGNLVLLHSSPSVDLAVGGAFVADGVRIVLSPDRDRPVTNAGLREANMVFELEQGLAVGYRGAYRCST